MTIGKDGQDGGYKDRVPQHGRHIPSSVACPVNNIGEQQLQQVDEKERHGHHAQDDEDGAQHSFFPVRSPFHFGKEERQGHGRREERQAHYNSVPQVIVKASENACRQYDCGQPVCDYDYSFLHSRTKIRILLRNQNRSLLFKAMSGDLTSVCTDSTLHY